MGMEALWDRARLDLVIVGELGEQDPFLWEHSVRVARVAQHITQFPEVQQARVDSLATISAALYHDSGWRVRFQAKEVSRGEILAHTPCDSHREDGARFLERSLSKFLPQGSLARASQILQHLDDRRSELFEVLIVRDADLLDEFGILSMWPTIRRGRVEGKGVQAVLDTWHRRKEYRYWEARLADSFHFDSIRALAQRRLDNLEQVMENLERQHRGDDLVFDELGQARITRQVFS